MKPNAAVRRWPAEIADVGRAMDGVAAIEEHRPWHRRIVILLRPVLRRQPVGIPLAGRGPVTAPATRYRKSVDEPFVEIDVHPLVGEVDTRDQGRAGNLTR